jgi:hypothetical protein
MSKVIYLQPVTTQSDQNMKDRLKDDDSYNFYIKKMSDFGFSPMPLKLGVITESQNDENKNLTQQNETTNLHKSIMKTSGTATFNSCYEDFKNTFINNRLKRTDFNLKSKITSQLKENSSNDNARSTIIKSVKFKEPDEQEKVKFYSNTPTVVTKLETPNDEIIKLPKSAFKSPLMCYFPIKSAQNGQNKKKPSKL